HDTSDDLSFTSIARAYGMGDLDGDLDIDTFDYRLFEAAYNAANGAGAFVAMLQGQPVPEPSTLLVVALGLPLAAALRRRQVLLRLGLLGCVAACTLSGESQAQTVDFRFANGSELDEAPIGTPMVRSPDGGPFNRITVTATDARAPMYTNPSGS